MTSGIFEIIRLGGPIMWLIFAGSAVGVAVFAERLLYYRRLSIPMDDFRKGVFALLRDKRYAEALERCDEAYGPSVQIIRAGILRRDLSKPELKEVVQEVAQLQVPRLESNLPLLSTIAHIAPLLGLLGTVVGMIKAFMSMNTAMGAAPISDLAGGIWEALITTAGGLSIAIPAYVAYNFLHARFNGIVTDMERSGIEVVQVLKGEYIFPVEAPKEPEGEKVKDAKGEDKREGEGKEPLSKTREGKPPENNSPKAEDAKPPEAPKS